MAGVIQKTVRTEPVEAARPADSSAAPVLALSQLEAARVSLERNREALALLSKA